MEGRRAPAGEPQALDAQVRRPAHGSADQDVAAERERGGRRHARSVAAPPRPVVNGAVSGGEEVVTAPVRSHGWPSGPRPLRRPAGSPPRERTCPRCGATARTLHERCPACGVALRRPPPGEGRAPADRGARRRGPPRRRARRRGGAGAAAPSTTASAGTRPPPGSPSPREKRAPASACRRPTAAAPPARPAADASASERLRARHALVVAAEAAITADARRRVGTGELEGPIVRTACGPVLRAPDAVPDDRVLSKPVGRFDCIAIRRRIADTAGRAVADFGYPYVTAPELHPLHVDVPAATRPHRASAAPPWPRCASTARAWRRRGACAARATRTPARARGGAG